MPPEAGKGNEEVLFYFEFSLQSHISCQINESGVYLYELLHKQAQPMANIVRIYVKCNLLQLFFSLFSHFILSFSFEWLIINAFCILKRLHFYP